MCAVYAFMRECDDLSDDPREGGPSAARAALDAWRHDLTSALNGGSLIVNGSISNTTLTATAGTLGGTGYIGTPIINNDTNDPFSNQLKEMADFILALDFNRYPVKTVAKEDVAKLGIR